MDNDTPIEPGPVSGEEKYQLRIEPKAEPAELHKLPLWLLWPTLIPLFVWMIVPQYGAICFAVAAVLLFAAIWIMLRKERSVDTTSVDRELLLYLLTAMTGGFALACCVFVSIGHFVT